MRFECAATGSLLTSRSAGLSEAERLRLESHLASCDRCCHDAVWLDALVDLADGVPWLTARQRDRVIAAALESEPMAAPAPAPQGRRAGLVVGMAAAAGLVLAGRALLAGGDAPVAPTAELPVTSSRAVAIAPAAEPLPPPTADRAAAASDPTATGDRARGEQPIFAGDGSRAQPTTYRAELARRTAADWLTEARAALARGQTDRAERAVGAALDADPSRRERAEAGTLRAEMALVAGDRRGAAKRFLEVADRFAGSRAAENALMAAARLQAAEGDRDAARATWRRYLDDYPNGRFRDDATRRLTGR